MTLFASSVSVYGASLNDGLIDETAAPRPLDAYGRSKLAAEGALADMLAPSSRLVIARPVNHSGPRQSEKHFVLSSFAAQIAAIEAGRGEPELRVGDLSKARDFLDVRDVVEAYRALIAKAPEMPRVGIFNIASGEPHTIGDLLDRLRGRATRPFETRVQTEFASVGGRSALHRLRRDKAARDHRMAPPMDGGRHAAIPARPLARHDEFPRMSEPTPETGDARDERIRLLDYQLGYLRAELTQLTRQRDLMVYSASWHIFAPLRRLSRGWSTRSKRFGGAWSRRPPPRG